MSPSTLEQLNNAYSERKKQYAQVLEEFDRTDQCNNLLFQGLPTASVKDVEYYKYLNAKAIAQKQAPH